MNTNKRLLILAACVLLTAPGISLAQQGESNDFPNDLDVSGNPGNTHNVAPAHAGSMSVDLNMNQCPDVATAAIVSISGPETGGSVAAKMARELCVFAANATNGKYNVSGDGASPGCTDLASCCGGGSLEGVALDLEFVEKTGNTPCDNGGFTMLKDANGVRVRINALGGDDGNNRIVSLLTSTSPDAGNTMTVDLLPNYVLRVDKNGVDGLILFGALDPTDPNGPVTWSVDSTGLDDQALHDAIAAAYASNVSGLSCAGASDRWAAEYSGSPQFVQGGGEVYTGFFNHCEGLDQTGVTELSVRVPEGMKVVRETTIGPVAPETSVPTLSTWGMILLVLLLAVMAGWILRSRQSRQAV